VFRTTPNFGELGSPKTLDQSALVKAAPLGQMPVQIGILAGFASAPRDAVPLNRR